MTRVVKRIGLLLFAVLFPAISFVVIDSLISNIKGFIKELENKRNEEEMDEKSNRVD